MAFLQNRLNTYDTLVTAITGWLARPDDPTDPVLAAIPDYIRLCEARLNTELRGQVNQRRSWAYINEPVEGLPTDFLAPSHVSLVQADDRAYSLTPMSVRELRDRYSYAGSPCAYAIAGPQIMFGPYVEYDVDAVETELSRFEIVYFAEIPPLTDPEVDTNDVLLKHPDLYLMGSLVEAGSFTVSDQTPMWESRFKSALDKANLAGMDAILGGATVAPPDNVV